MCLLEAEVQPSISKHYRKDLSSAWGCGARHGAANESSEAAGRQPRLGAERQHVQLWPLPVLCLRNQRCKPFPIGLWALRED